MGWWHAGFWGDGYAMSGVRQPEEVWINKPPEDPEPVLALPLIGAA